jgi:hypothetical protein
MAELLGIPLIPIDVIYLDHAEANQLLLSSSYLSSLQDNLNRMKESEAFLYHSDTPAV